MDTLLSLELSLSFVVVAIERELAVDGQNLRQDRRVSAHLNVFRCDFLIFFAYFREFASFYQLENAKFVENDILAAHDI